MIFTLIAIGVLIIGVTLWVIFDKTDVGEWAAYVGVFLTMFGAVFTLIFGAVSIYAACSNDYEYEDTMISRENYIDVLKTGVYDDSLNISDIDTIQEIQEFNKSIVANQRGLKNPWINWFYGPYWNDIEPIDLSEYLNKQKVGG